MAQISQKTLVEMMRVASKLGIYETSFGQPPLVSPTEMRRFMFAKEFPMHMLDRFEQMYWNFDAILPLIKSGEFIRVERSSRGWTTPAIAGQIVEPESLLVAIASALVHKAVEINQHSVYGSLVNIRELIGSLEDDGYEFRGDELIVADAVIDIPEQITEFERALNSGSHDAKALVTHHLREAERHQSSGDWGAAASEWRHVFEESYRGAWRFTRSVNREYSTRLEKPSFADVLSWLEQSGFLTSEERAAAGAGFGFLSVGNHPGVKEEQIAYLTRTMALPLAYVCLLKLGSWDGRRFSS